MIDSKKRFLIGQDWSSWGDISLQSATTIFNILGVPAIKLPVHLLAAHPGWDPKAPQQDLSAWIKQVLTFWPANKWAGVYLGYLGTTAMVEQWCFYVKDCPQLVIVDPAMGDHGHLYRSLDADYVLAQQKLLANADVITPNVTEAQLLLQHPITDLKQALLELQELIKGSQAVITSVIQGSQIGCAYLSHEHLQLLMQPRQERDLFGSGDLFTSLLAALLFTGIDWEEALEQATQLVTKAVRQTVSCQKDVQIKPIVADLMNLGGNLE
ncbi:PfkB family carbohydrate kinase [Bombilactobacillus thymidiniphilus]|uniref:pyridoxal kinase n=1 Tax=Bombilactobacillus thymidiniphilus TaxID=2923363 RepID=A0ABY4PCC0_9LACO|nr:PfkB family carbohydrate kinase [Bombilactobacillus thymidiniphilus]UQS83151.1 PfkB family carbohydrate kinase [Bombilactobacillus thymidiniphilus]